MLWLLQHRCGNVGTPLHRKLAIAKAKCARLVLHLFEKKFPDDARPRQAIEAAEAYGESAAAYAAAYAAAAADAPRIERDAQATDLRELLGAA